MGTPATLPANFFEGKTGQASPPQTLPANFDFKTGAAPAPPNNDPTRGAAQATGLSPDTRSSAGKMWDEIKRGLTSAQAGQGLKPQPTVLANAAQFAGMAGDTLAQFGVAPPAAEAASAAERTVGKLFKPTSSMVPTTSNLLGPTGKPLIKMVEQEGPSVASKAVDKLNKTSLVKLVKKAVAAYGGYEAAKKLGLPLP
jgi:hypothetical protein